MPVQFFVPCYVDQQAPEAALQVAGLFDRLGVAWEYPAEQTCCGQFALTVGDLATARRLMRHFLRVFGGEGDIVCPSPSCTLMVRHHYPELAEGLAERRQAERVAARILELSEWLAARSPLPWKTAFAGVLALHRSCKAKRLGVCPAATRVLAQVQGLTLREVSPYYACCGFGGPFSYQHPDLLVSLDLSCLLHLRAVAAGHRPALGLHYLAELLQPDEDG
ncbi:MAG: (Fe-S)-binding protein [Deltaproteobacteria bacterium]|nr:(Fe-S)-binding protein [Deltaproteobacteria bacterium]